MVVLTKKVRKKVYGQTHHKREACIDALFQSFAPFSVLTVFIN